MKGLSVTTPPLKELFPIGSIYINVNTINPGTIFGGTWEQIEDKFLLCSGSTYENGTAGGSATHVHGTQEHTLTIDEIPSHKHTINRMSWAASKPSGYGSSVYLWAYDTSDIYPVSESYFNNTGGSGSHSHGNTTSTSTLPPYLAVTVWKRNFPPESFTSVLRKPQAVRRPGPLKCTS